jgi:hypothetical protein
MAEARFRKGDRVRFQMGLRTMQGEIKEDRGPIGVKGRHLYLVKFRSGPHSEEPSEVELPAAEMELVREAVSAE